MLARFAYYHPRSYDRLLKIFLAVMVIAGLNSMLTAQALRISFVRPMHPPVDAQTDKVTQEPVKPAGWEDQTRLPGRSGSGSVRKPGETEAQAVIASSIAAGNVAAMAMGREMNAAVFGDQHWPSLQALWNRESNWNPSARNRYSGACGIPQALPCSKIPDMSTAGQISWGLNYIKQRYGNPSNAYRFWLAHHWY